LITEAIVLLISWEGRIQKYYEEIDEERITLKTNMNLRFFV